MSSSSLSDEEDNNNGFSFKFPSSYKNKIGSDIKSYVGKHKSSRGQCWFLQYRHHATLCIRKILLYLKKNKKQVPEAID